MFLLITSLRVRVKEIRFKATVTSVDDLNMTTLTQVMLYQSLQYKHELIILGLTALRNTHSVSSLLLLSIDKTNTVLPD